ncbi:DUF5060 domain-containing protein [Akkermansiaceae bacterium]|nr:DUF5060 domain-containing protein [Akkermansiaceae bacterium]
MEIGFTVTDGAAPAPLGPVATSKIAKGVHGELKKWHRVGIVFEGPGSWENGTPNPFLDYRLNVVFRHAASGRSMVVPGYFAADGAAGETGEGSGKIWRVNFSPPETGEWNYEARFRAGKGVAVEDGEDAGAPARLDGNPDGIVKGKFTVGQTDKTGRDNRARGRLEYVGERYLRWAETGKYFLKQGADSPENLFAYADFDGDFKSDGQKDKLVKTYGPHVQDWKTGDPTWQDGKGKGLIGAINYLASEGVNSISFMTMNIEGDDRNVFMYTAYGERVRIDVSRMDQWEVVMDHADRMGFHLHFKTQEAENDTLLDNGDLGVERKLYYRELIARFGHHLALNWNLGEENNKQTDLQRREMARYFNETDPYGHNIVIHTYPPQKSKIHTPLLGEKSKLTGLSMQGSDPKFGDVHKDVLEWVEKSTAAGKPWVVAYDEPGSAQEGLMNDAEDAKNPQGKGNYADARHKALWGVLLAGGTGTEWYFGYKFDHSDLTLQDFRSRDKWWDSCRHALTFFSDNKIPFQEMRSDNAQVGNSPNGNEAGYCFSKPGDTYVVYLPKGGERDLWPEGGSAYSIRWFDPRNGGRLQVGSKDSMLGGIGNSMGLPPSDPDKDWVVLVRKK